MKNFQAWKEVRFSNAKISEIINERRLWERAQRYLEPGSKLQMTKLEKQIVSNPDRPFRYLTMLTPIFLDEQKKKNGNFIKMFKEIFPKHSIPTNPEKNTTPEKNISRNPRNCKSD